MKKWLVKYKQLVKGDAALYLANSKTNLKFWQDDLFYSLLVYCLPFSFIAVIPGVFMSLNDGYFYIAAVDLVTLLVIIIVTFANKWPLTTRKILLLIAFYILAVFFN